MPTTALTIALNPRRSLRARFALVLGGSGLVFAMLTALAVDRYERAQLADSLGQAMHREALLLSRSLNTALQERQQTPRQAATEPMLASGRLAPGDARLLLAALPRAMQAPDRRLPGSDSLVIDRHNRVLIGPAPLLDSTLPLASLQALLDGAAPQVLRWPDGHDYLTALGRDGSPAAAGPGAELAVLLRQPAGLAFEAADVLRRRLIGIGIGATTLFFLLSFWLAGRIARPVQALSAAAIQVGQGQAPAFQAITQQRNDEVAELDANGLDHLAQIQQASSRMGGLIDGLLALSRSTRGAMRNEPIDLSALANRVVAKITFDAQAIDGQRWFCVTDNGAGFDMAHAGRLFKAFARLHRQDEFAGIGIGLATVQRIIHRHGGEIVAQATAGAGASFRFTLPQRSEAPRGDRAAMKQRHILLVEDNPQDELLALRALRRAQVANRVDVVRDGQQALDYLFCDGEFAHCRSAEQPAVVLLDIGLPRLTGLEVLASLRADPRTRLLPVVMLTSSDEDADRLASYLGGANSFVRKPLAFAEFAETVARLGVYWLATDGPARQVRP